MNQNELKDPPLVFIGVPVYNGGDYFEECLESIHRQTYQNWECAIIDNQSKDDTNKIAQKYVEKDRRFKLYVNDEFVDQTSNWNISFYKVNEQAKYFKIVCADDWLFPDYLESMVPVMEARTDVGFCSSYRIDGELVRCDGLDYYDGNYFDGKQILIKQLKKKIDITGSVNTILFRIETLKKLEYYPEIFRPDVYHIDTVLAYDVLNISNLGFVYKVLSYTRRHNETYTAKISERFKTGYYLQDMELQKFMHLDPSLKKVYKRNKLDYAYFLLKKKISDKKCIEWHKKYKKGKFYFNDYIWALISRNIISRQLKKIFT
jgi:glycosyltransferase involved in cell wall biosynthesis